MITKIQKWGNSLGVRIPKSFAAEVHVSEGASVDMTVSDGNLVLKPVVTPQYSLKDLLSGVKTTNLHAEMDTGEAVGNEIW